jgi:hypothetical protein
MLSTVHVGKAFVKYMLLIVVIVCNYVIRGHDESHGPALFSDDCALWEHYGLGRLQRLHPALPWVHDVIYLAYRADGHRTRAALRLKDALIAYGRRLGTDTESQLIQQELQEGRAATTDRAHLMQGND